MYDTNAIKSAATGRWPEILSRLSGFGVDYFDGSHKPCPKCGGTDRFRFTNLEGGGSCLCNQCGRNVGDGIASVMWLLGIDFKQALTKLAEYLGIRETKQSKANGRQPRQPNDDLTFRPWNEGLATLFCMKKSPVTSDALAAAGARFATYKVSRKSFHDTFTVLAAPVYRATDILTTSDPEGWAPCGQVLWNVLLENQFNRAVGKLPVFDKSGNIAGWEKMLSTRGSISGLMLTHGLQRLSLSHPCRKDIEVVWKVGGPSDGFSLFSAIPPHLRDRHLVVTNSGGENENVRPEAAELFRGLKVCVVQDCDDAGQMGAAKWLKALYGVAEEVRQVKLPYPVEKSHGRDLRDWLMDTSNSG